MKKLLLLAITGMFLISCGGGGWSEEDKTMAMKDCIEEGGNETSQCECVIGKSESQFASYSAMMEKMENGPESPEEEEELFEWMMKVGEDCGVDF